MKNYSVFFVSFGYFENYIVVYDLNEIYFVS